MPLPLRRSRAGASLLLSFGAVVLVSVALLAGSSVFLAGSTLQAMRNTLADAPATDAALRVSSSFDATTAATEDAATRAVVSDAFSGVPIVVWRSVRTAPLPIRTLDASGSPTPRQGDSGARAPTVVLQSDDRAESGTTIVRGRWPSGPRDAALEEHAADALGVAVGDRIVVGPEGGDREFVISALWRADDPLAVRWFADPAVASGHSGEAVGPLIVSEADLSALVAAATTRWILEPDAGSLTLADRAVIDAASRDGALAELLARADVFGSNSVTVEGGLHDQVARTSQAASAARAVALMPAVLVATLSMIALLQLATLLAGSRSADTRLLRARGASVIQLTLWAAVETGVVAAAAAVLGAVAGVGAGWLLADRVGDLTGSLAGGGVIAVATALVAAVLGTARAAAAARTAGGRASAAWASGTPVLVAALFASALSVLAGWQLIAAGSPLLGGVGADLLNPLAVLAPGIGLLALALFAVAAVAPLIRVTGAGARRARSLTRLLVVRTLTRRASLFTVAVLVTALAAGGAMFAAVVSGSLVDADQRTAALQTGTDVRARFTVPSNVDLDGPVVSSAVATDAPGATAAAAALSTTATLGTDDIGLVALPEARVPRLVPNTQLAEAVGALSSGVATPPGLAILPAGSTALTLTVTLTGTDSAPLTDTAGTVTVAAWLVDAGGAVSEISLGGIDAATVANGTDFTGRLPASVGESTLLGLDVARVGSAEESRSTIALGHAAVVDAGGQLLPVGLTDADRPSVDVTRQTPRGRILAPAAAERVPVAFTTALAARLGVGVGEELTLVPSTGQSVDIVIAATVDAVPGSGRELVSFADSAALLQGILHAGGAVPLPSEVWVATSAPDETAASIAATSALPVTITTRAEASAAPVFEPAVTAVRAGVAGGVAIALVCLVAVVAALLRARRGESAVLSALGSARRDDVAERRSEAGAAIGYGLIAGAVAGVLTASLFAPTFARAAVPGAEAAGPVYGFDALIAGVALVTLAAGAVMVVGVYGALVRRSR